VSTVGSREALIDRSSPGWYLKVLTHPDFGPAPWPFYAELRRGGVARDPFETDVSRPTVIVSRHEDVERVLKDPQLFSSEFGKAVGGLGHDRPLIPLEVDPPAHKRYRVLLDPFFSPRRIAELEAGVATLVNGLIDRFPDGGCEFMADFAVPLPATVFLTLLGLPLEDLSVFLAIKDKIVRGGGHHSIVRQAEVRAEGGREWHDYFDAALEALATERRPGLLGELIHAEDDGMRLSREEIIDVCYLLFIAGLDTVTSSLSCFWMTLIKDERLRRRIVDDPELIPAAVEELMRWESPVSMVARVATADTDIDGCAISKGDTVLVLLGSANTDPAACPHADQVDLDRAGNRHFAFGGGIHRCLGSHLARLELRVALREWHRRIPKYRLAPGVEPAWAPIPRSAVELPLLW
jgi:cytochrome P450